MTVIKVYKQSMPQVKLIGKRYTNRDRDTSGTFAGFWQQWAREGWFETLKQCSCIPGVSGDFLGAMRMTGDGEEFEYWIGAFFAPDAAVPEGFAAAEIPAGELGVCWLCGNEASGELFGMEASDLSMAALAEKGWRFSPTGWFLERYNDARYTKPDEAGNVILDICAYLV